MTRLQAQVAAGVFEHGAGRVALELGVLVIAAAGLCFDALKKATQTSDFALNRVAARLHVDGDRILRHRAVVRAEITGRQAHITLVEKD